jgi:F-type H+-transporting ATPase subunit b
MPQLEQVEFFISQLFWLGVFFVILFSVLTYITLPKIRAFLNQRDDFVKSHISKQDELIKKAESIIENYEAKLTEAKNQASEIINEAKDKALQESETLIKATEEKIQQEIRQTEERVTKEKDLAISELNVQLKDSATNFISKVTKIEKGNITI